MCKTIAIILTFITITSCRSKAPTTTYYIEGNSKACKITYKRDGVAIRLKNPSLPVMVRINKEHFCSIAVSNEDELGFLTICIDDVCSYILGKGVLLMQSKEFITQATL